MLELDRSVSLLRTFPKGSKAASLLLYSLWNDKNLQAAVKKVNYSNYYIYLKPCTCLRCPTEAVGGSHLNVCFYALLAHSHFLLPAAPPKGLLAPLVQSHI